MILLHYALPNVASVLVEFIIFGGYLDSIIYISRLL